MPVKHTLHRAEFTAVEVEIPDRCPRCDADFTEPGSLHEGNWNDALVSSHIDPGVPVERDERLRMVETSPSLEAEGYTDIGDTYLPYVVACANPECDWQLMPPAEGTCSACGQPDRPGGHPECAEKARSA